MSSVIPAFLLISTITHNGMIQSVRGAEIKAGLFQCELERQARFGVETVQVIHDAGGHVVQQRVSVCTNVKPEWWR